MGKNELRESIQSGHLNFLLGSGLSSPFLKTLGDIENTLSQLEQHGGLSEDVKTVARTSILKKYFEKSIQRNLDLLNEHNDCKPVLKNYLLFISTVNSLISKRRLSILDKQINLFTTNIDIFLEVTLENLGVEFNDGFIGTLKPSFALSNFKKSVLKTSPHYGTTSELPLFNIHKLHGSITWKIEDESKPLTLDNSLSQIEKIKKALPSQSKVVDIEKFISGDTKIKSLAEILEESKKISADIAHKTFLDTYDQLPIINPSKEKFKFTTLNYTYYELLRMFSNELERENALLYVMGFSFADEHISEIVLRALSSNPTLIVHIFAYDETSLAAIKKNLKYDKNEARLRNLKFENFIFETDPNDSNSKKAILYSLDKIVDHHLKPILENLNND